MAKPYIHAVSSARKFGGQPTDYVDIHNLMDSSKSVVTDPRHRALTHNSWFISVVIERVFGSTRVNSDGKTYSTRDIAEQHVAEDYGGRFIPSAQDFIDNMTLAEWMRNGRGEAPRSHQQVEKPITRNTKGVK